MDQTHFHTSTLPWWLCRLASYRALGFLWLVAVAWCLSSLLVLVATFLWDLLVTTYIPHVSSSLLRHYGAREQSHANYSSRSCDHSLFSLGPCSALLAVLLLLRSWRAVRPLYELHTLPDLGVLFGRRVNLRYRLYEPACYIFFTRSPS